MPFCFCILLMNFEWGKKMCFLLLQGCSIELGWCAMQRSRKALLERRAIQKATSGRNYVYLYKVSLSLVFVLWGLVFLFSLWTSHGHGYGGIVYLFFIYLWFWLIDFGIIMWNYLRGFTPHVVINFLYKLLYWDYEMGSNYE